MKVGRRGKTSTLVAREATAASAIRREREERGLSAAGEARGGDGRWQ